MTLNTKKERSKEGVGTSMRLAFGRKWWSVYNQGSETPCAKFLLQKDAEKYIDVFSKREIGKLLTAHYSARE